MVNGWRELVGGSRPRLVLLCGLPGSGKTTLAARLARETPALRLDSDEWPARLGIDLFDEQTRDRLERLFWQLAQDLLRQGQSVILESGFWLRSDRAEKRISAHALGAAVELHYLDVPHDELCRRLDRRRSTGAWRSMPVTAEQLARYATFFQAPDRAEMQLFDQPQAVASR